MAKREFTFKTLPDGCGWAIHNPVTDTRLGEIRLPMDDTPQYRQCALYGLKQWASDGGAKDAGTSPSERLKAIIARGRAIVAGVVAFRDGHGSAAVKLPDAALFAAVVGAGIMQSTDAHQKIWRDAAPDKRLRFASDARVQQWLADNAPSASAAADSLDEFLES